MKKDTKIQNYIMDSKILIFSSTLSGLSLNPVLEYLYIIYIPIYIVYLWKKL